MQGQQRQMQKKRIRFPWIRAIAMLLVSLLLSAAAILLILSIEHVVADYWLVVIPVIFTVIGQLILLGQWLFPISTESKSDPPSPLPTPIEVKVSLSPSLAEPTTQNEQAMSAAHATSSSSAQLGQQYRDVIQAIGRAVQAQQGPERPTKVAALLLLLQDRYSKQDVIDTLERFYETGDIRLHKVFGGTLASSFQLAPHGKRKLSLIR